MPVPPCPTAVSPILLGVPTSSFLPKSTHSPPQAGGHRSEGTVGSLWGFAGGVGQGTSCALPEEHWEQQIKEEKRIGIQKNI